MNKYFIYGTLDSSNVLYEFSQMSFDFGVTSSDAPQHILNKGYFELRLFFCLLYS